jgi:hypothetical protein
MIWPRDGYVHNVIVEDLDKKRDLHSNLHARVGDLERLLEALQHPLALLHLLLLFILSVRPENKRTQAYSTGLCGRIRNRVEV